MIWVSEEGIEARRSRIYRGCDWVRSSSASTACAATYKASRSPSAPLSSGCNLCCQQTSVGIRCPPRPRRA